MNEFDSYAEEYEAALACGISVSGESADFFAQSRIAWLARCLRQFPLRPHRILDFGCGTGTATRFFFEELGAQFVVGVDTSEESLKIARQRATGRPASFRLTEHVPARGDFQLAYCNGVFHHIPVAERDRAARYVADSLQPGGVFALWENNPWSPAARLVMSRIPFDKDAIMVWPREARRLLDDSGLKVIQTDFCFIFPKSLSALRGMERHLTALPLGAQYLVLAQKPTADRSG